MNWYYVEQGKQAGPVNDEQFDEMIRSGRITADALVWHEGMSDWRPCGEVRGGAGSGGMAITGGETKPEAVCAECGKIFPADEMIRYGAVSVCAGCKPVFLQKLQEGATINTGDLNYAGFGIRLGAYLIDAVILFVVNMMFAMLTGFAIAATVGAGSRGGAPIVIQLILTAINLMVAVGYESILVGKYGATLGKMAVKIKVVTADGGRVSYARAFGRYFAKILSGLTCLIGFIIAAFDNPQRRALHDHICNTRVVYK
jgi:uncharacterized RDD family membrane protein YckC